MFSGVENLGQDAILEMLKNAQEIGPAQKELADLKERNKNYAEYQNRRDELASVFEEIGRLNFKLCMTIMMMWKWDDNVALSRPIKTRLDMMLIEGGGIFFHGRAIIDKVYPDLDIDDELFAAKNVEEGGRSVFPT